MSIGTIPARTRRRRGRTPILVFQLFVGRRKQAGRLLDIPPATHQLGAASVQNTGNRPLECSAFDSVPTYLWRRHLAAIARRSLVSPERPIGHGVLSCWNPALTTTSSPARPPTPSPQPRLPPAQLCASACQSHETVVRLPRYQCDSKHRLCNTVRRSFHL
ncbi:hypothetical protein CC86DRAFT_65711 [Ophiobolus disseminans]|uniref:Uncharacterized protein n=1 Tax=Ophiobolus disseminans TaxID=1469910 RepID=A0A6A6ZS65_9PLEO|nr:hypothetical protein CC86DRAFT_65711 [Ophiobolus disseminans]